MPTISQPFAGANGYNDEDSGLAKRPEFFWTFNLRSNTDVETAGNRGFKNEEMTQKMLYWLHN
jgi:hypothetical protein